MGGIIHRRVKDALSRASEMVEIYVKDRKELREKIREDAAAVQALSEWAPKRLTQWELDFAKVKAGSVARLVTQSMMTRMRMNSSSESRRRNWTSRLESML